MSNIFTCQLGNGSGIGAQLQQLDFIVSFGDWLGMEFFLEENYCLRS